VDAALEELAHGDDGHGTSFRREPAGSALSAAGHMFGPHSGCQRRPVAGAPGVMT